MHGAVCAAVPSLPFFFYLLTCSWTLTGPFCCPPLATDRPLAKREGGLGNMCVTALGVTLAACLVYSAAREDRHFVRYTPEAGLAQRSVSTAVPSAAQVNRLAAQLAAKEVQKDVIAAGTKHASPKVRHVLSSLVAAPTNKLQAAVDCARLLARAWPPALPPAGTRGRESGSPDGCLPAFTD